MEVHQHTHTERKKFTHYLWEFLMLFLAVFCGFLAENFREGLINKEKAHHYMENMAADLKADVAAFDSSTYYMQLWYDHLDSALKIPVESLRNINSQDSFLYHFYPYYSYVGYCEQSDNTIIQLKAGGFNLIHDKQTIDSINAVYGFYKGVKFSTDYNVTAYWDAVKKAQEIMKLPSPAIVIQDAIPKSVMTNTVVFVQFDQAAIQQLYNKLENSKGSLMTAIVFQKQYREQAAGLLAYLRRKYHIK
ncbi:MAG TPA: hypothetical protein VGQ53_01545 [Chitinophagaceae bacterium]|jgi:hypothetical protein|nr:hypothetical protein [Chitinophagaceae bacterium]